jgi:hypothetical protein
VLLAVLAFIVHELVSQLRLERCHSPQPPPSPSNGWEPHVIHYDPAVTTMAGAGD